LTITQGDKKVWIRVVDRKTGQGWDVSPDWLKQHLGICNLGDAVAHLMELDYLDLSSRIKELEQVILDSMRHLRTATLKLHFKVKGEIDTRELNKFIENRGLRLERRATRDAFESMVADGTLQFKSQGKGHPRLWSLKEAEQ